MLGGGQSFVIWGAGKRGLRLLDYLQMSRVDVLAFLDSNPELQGEIISGIPVLSPEVYLQKKMKEIIIISPFLHKDIETWLQSHGQKRYLLYRDVALADFDNDAVEAELAASQNSMEDTSDEWHKQQSDLLNYFQELNWKNIDDYLQKNLRAHYLVGTDETDTPANALELLKKSERPVGTKMATSILGATSICSNQEIALAEGVMPHVSDFDLLIMHGLRLNPVSYCLLQEAAWKKIPIIFQEQGFLHSVIPYAVEGVEERFAYTHAVLLQRGNVYINAENPSYIEYVLASAREFSEAEKQRARRCIESIKNNKLSKYNSQPIEFNIPKGSGKGRVLVIDQVYGDKSIEYSLASDDDFAIMLENALSENPDADIYIKVHPASNRGHYGQVKENNRLHLLSKPVNPIALLEQMDTVYTCASTMGFEALMCGCDVHCFGLPFYAGWGLTKDKISCLRRTSKRSLEEVFYVAYILASTYVSYETKEICEIEQTIEELVALRKEYFELVSM